MWAAIIPLLGPIIKKIFPDPEQQAKAKSELAQMMYDSQARELEAKSKVVIAEAKGGALQRNWRPLLMFTFIILIIFNYIAVPITAMFGVIIPALTIPPEMWTLLTLGVTGYITGRSAEKIMQSRAVNKEAFYSSVRSSLGALHQKDIDVLEKALKESQKASKEK